MTEDAGNHTGAGQRLLLVEDSPLDEVLIRNMLPPGEGFEVRVAHNLADALVLVEAERFDAVLLDAHLPDASQLEGPRQMLPWLHDTPLLMIAVDDDQALAEDVCRMGVQEYLLKQELTQERLWRAIRLAAWRHGWRSQTALDEKTAADASTLLQEQPAGGSGEVTSVKAELEAAYHDLLFTQEIRHPLRYRFPEILGKGVQGVVFRAEREGARGCVTTHAVKVFDPMPYVDSQGYWEDMERIARQVTAMQRHGFHHVLATDNFLEVRGVGFVEMEIISGTELACFMNPTMVGAARKTLGDTTWQRYGEPLLVERSESEFALQPAAVVHILRQVLRGMENLHGMGYLHLDLKPGNIMVDRAGYAKIIDLGRAVQVGEELERLLVSPFFCAPEIQFGAVAHPSADVYSLGMLALTLLLGDCPVRHPEIEGDEDLNLAMRPQKEALPDRLEALVPDDLTEKRQLLALLRGMLHPEPRERMQSVHEIDDAGLQSIQVTMWRRQPHVEIPRCLETVVGAMAG